MIETLLVHRGHLLGARRHHHLARWRQLAATAKTLALRTLDMIITMGHSPARKLSWLGKQRQGMALPLLLMEDYERVG
jgi:hypothetical protein